MNYNTIVCNVYNQEVAIVTAVVNPLTTPSSEASSYWTLPEKADQLTSLSHTGFGGGIFVIKFEYQAIYILLLPHSYICEDYKKIVCAYFEYMWIIYREIVCSV